MPKHGGKIVGKFLEEVRSGKADRTILTRLKKEMKAEEYKDLVQALKDSTISAGAIQRTLTKRGYVASTSALTALRRSWK
jgi:hypothetical protein